MEIVTVADFVDVCVKLRKEGLPDVYGEIFDPEDEVERSGYRTTEQQVAELLFAGERLAAYRAEKYHFGDGKDDGFMPPKVDDLTVADDLAKAIKKRQSEKLKAAEEAAALKAAEEKAKADKDAADLAAFRAKESASS